MPNRLISCNLKLEKRGEDRLYSQPDYLIVVIEVQQKVA